MAKRTRARLAGESAMFLLVLGAALVLVNVLGGLGANARIDTTEARAFSLSSGSKKLAKSLEDQMEIRAYFSEELPPPFNALGTYVRDLLSEYRDASGGKITLKLISPKTDEEKQAAEKDGVQRTADQKLEADSFGVQEGYRGVSFHYMGESKAIARIDSTAGLEYEITQLIKQMVGVKTKIGVLGGHEGATPSAGLSSLKEYMPGYEMTEVQATAEIDPALKALLIVHPTTALTDEELRRIDQYVMQGGSLAVFGGGVKINQPDQQTGQTDPNANPVDTGLNKLLEKWGVTLDNRIVADTQCGRARMSANIGGLQIPMPVPYPPAPIVSFDDEARKHPALFRLNQIGFPYPVRLALNDNLKGDKDVKTTVLIRSSQQSWLMEGDTIDLKARERWDVPGYNGPYTLGIAIEGKLPSAFGSTATSQTPEDEAAAAKGLDRATKPARVIVFGTGYFMRDELLPKPERANQAMAGSVVLALNAIDWLAQDNDLIEIRAKTIEDPMLEVPLAVKETEATIRDAVEQQDQAKAEAAFEKRKEAIKEWDQRKNAYRWGNTLAIPGLFALLGIVRWRVRTARKANLSL